MKIWDITTEETSEETPEILETALQEKITKQFAVIAGKNATFLSSRLETDLFTAGNASRNTDLREEIKQYRV